MKIMSGTKHDEGKQRMDLIPEAMIRAVATVLSFGAVKYGDHNWRKGIKNSRLYAACMRHMWAWWAGESLDPESGKSHLWHAATNIGMLIENEELRPELDDRYNVCHNETKQDYREAYTDGAYIRTTYCAGEAVHRKPEDGVVANDEEV